jgi:hypothetical protein
LAVERDRKLPRGLAWEVYDGSSLASHEVEPAQRTVF